MRNVRAVLPTLVLSLCAAGALAVTPAASAATSHASSASSAPSGRTVPADRTVPRLQAAGLASTVALDNCSGSLVRYPTSADSDRALLLTNGHCYEGGFLDAGEVLVDQPSSRTGRLLDADGDTLGTLRADKVLYATMTGTDVTLYELTKTFAQIRSAYGASALTIAGSHPADDSAVSIPSSYWKQTYSCSVDGFVPTLREGEWTWHDSIRYGYPDTDCKTIHGTSGSPIVDDQSLQVVGINNTGNDDGESCTENNPCEVDGDGTTHVQQGQNYGEQTYWFTTCLTAANAIDLGRSGCLLTKP